MSRIKIVFLFCIIFLLQNNVKAQTNKFTTFKKGDVIPDLELEMYEGSALKKIHLYDIKKKLILFDLWGVNCTSCIKSFPHMLELQKQFGDRIQIIVLTLNRKQEVENLWQKLKGHIPQIIIDSYRSLPTVVGDTLLFNSFPKNSVPAHVWIDSAHILRSISHGYSTTSTMIQDFISNKKMRFHDQMPQKIDFTNPLSWLNNDTGFLSNLKYYSFIFSRIEHAGSNDGQVNIIRDSVTGKIVGLSTVNMKISDLYKMAYFQNRTPMNIFNSKILLEIKDKGRFYPAKNIEDAVDWADTSLFCLAIKLPVDKSQIVYSTLQHLLDNYFHYQSKMEMRRVKCLVLKRIRSEDKFKTKGGTPVYQQLVSGKNINFIYKNQPLETLFSNLQTAVYETDAYLPFFNETGYEGNIDVIVPWSDDPKKISLEMIKNALNKYGLEIAEEYKDLEMLVISDAL